MIETESIQTKFPAKVVENSKENQYTDIKDEWVGYSKKSIIVKSKKYHRTLEIPIPNLENIDWLMKKSKIYMELISRRIFVDAKEISEVVSVVRKTLEIMDLDYIESNQDVLYIGVGDGPYPRSACMMSLYTKFDCVSIDPIMREEWVGKNKNGIQRLECVKSKIEYWIESNNEKVFDKYTYVYLGMVHSHAILQEFFPYLQKLIPKAKIRVVALPCCKSLFIKGHVPNEKYRDFGVFSPHRTLKVWKISPLFESKGTKIELEELKDN